MALWISRPVRRRLGLPEPARPGDRRLRVDDLRQVRRLAGEIGRPRPGEARPPGISAGELLASSAIEDELWARLALAGIDWRLALGALEESFGAARVGALLREFASAFGPRGAEERTDERRPEQLRDLVALWALERHPAAQPAAAVLHEGRPEPAPFLDALLAGEAAALRPLRAVLDAAASGPPSTEEAVRALAADRDAPSAADAGRRDRLLLAGDVLSEERRPSFAPPDAVIAPVPEAPRDWEPAPGPPRYGRDPEWAASLVLVAKQLPVWLDQLGIETLDEVPEKELARLGRRGFTGLWLVGLWERSQASRWIKQLCGNPEAAASAYSISSYEVARSLGGDGALDRLAERASRHGLRLAADMVPNHTGIDSRWVLEHPERFLSVPEPPFPGYCFSGPDLSPRPDRVGLYLEDHYYDASDAAVVFERLDRETGERRYLYHGNDGTGLPWNDTAQLDYRRSDVREAVIETVLAVARRFPVIRFDAAMTLTWKHFRRLWFPAPGEGGAIPSRAGHGVTEAALREAMPREFWAEVVERVAREAPDSLLLAEAFWLMEAHFARGLGVHRVYNSVFVNCLRQDRPAELRRQIDEILTLDRRLLERQVNYLSNPDEAPAREAFGDGPRFRAVSVLLATLPGTPLFAHGQVEGLRERYGMEYRRAYRVESEEPELAAWHERVLAPLLRRRRIFSGSGDFRLLALRDGQGRLVEEVLAFANGTGEELHVVVVELAGKAQRGTLVAAGDPEAAGRPDAMLAALGAACRDLVTGSAVREALAAGGGREVALDPWQPLVLTGFEASDRSSGPGPPLQGRPAPVHRTGRQALRTLLGAAGVLVLAAATLAGIERWVEGDVVPGGILLLVSVLGWTALAAGLWRRS